MKQLIWAADPAIIQAELHYQKYIKALSAYLAEQLFMEIDASIMNKQAAVVQLAEIQASNS